MDLILMRHADAVSADGYADDALRPLSKKGRQVQERVGKAMRKIGIAPDHALTSPRLRARQTAEITAAMLGLDALEELAVLAGGHSLEDLIAALRKYPTPETILCTGHEPDLSTWSAGLLSAGGTTPRIAFKKSGVIGLRFDSSPEPGTASLLFFYRPKDLLSLL